MDGPETIDEVLRQRKLQNQNTFVLANRIKFDPHTKKMLCMVHDPPIHSMNKCYERVRESPFFARTRSRKFVILMGDNISDTKMVEGIMWTLVFFMSARFCFYSFV